MSDDVVMFAMDRRIDRRIVLAAEMLMARGLTVRLLAPADGAPRDEPKWIQRIGDRTPGVHGVGLRIYRFVRDRIPLPREMLRSLTWRVIRRPEHAFVSLFAPALEGAVARVYIAHDLPMLPVAAAARGLHGGKILFDSHELYPEQEFSTWEKRLWRDVERRYIREADAVVTVNPSIAREISRRHGITEPIVVQNADAYQRARSACDRKRLRVKLNIPADTTVFLYQGGLTLSRNIETLVDAFGRVRDKNAMLVVLGDGPALLPLQRRARSAGVANRVRFHPAVPQAELLDMTRGADFGVIPYRANCLNMELCTPNKLFEFIMARVPIVATDLPEIRRIVAGYGIGFVGSTDNAEGFAHLIEEALEVSAARMAEWEISLEKAACELCWEREGVQYFSIVRDLASADSFVAQS